MQHETCAWDSELGSSEVYVLGMMTASQVLGCDLHECEVHDWVWTTSQEMVHLMHRTVRKSFVDKWH